MNTDILTTLPSLTMNHLYFNETDYDEVYDLISNSSRYYPGFYNWFYMTVMDGYLSGEREIITEYIDGSLAGVAIIKNTNKEKKLCNLTVSPRFKYRGVGIKLFKKSFELLDSSHPFLTVSEDKLSEFEKIFHHFGFKLTSKHSGLYKTGKTELFFNEKPES